MARLHVTCVNKMTWSGSQERISHIGGAGWKHAEDEAIRYIEVGMHSYYIDRSGFAVDLIVATRDGRKYLKMQDDAADGERPNNLLDLSECPP